MEITSGWIAILGSMSGDSGGYRYRFGDTASGCTQQATLRRLSKRSTTPNLQIPFFHSYSKEYNERPTEYHLHCLSRSGTDEGCYDHGFQSSNLSRFASQVAKFNATFYASLACNPSRACTWTGQYAHTKETLKWR